MKYDIISDCHGCLFELIQLIRKLGYEEDSSTLMYKHPDNRMLVSVGDIVSRGNYSVATYKFIKDMVEAGHMIAVCGNHDEKIMRWAKGNKVILKHGDDKTAEEMEEKNVSKEEIVNFISSLPYYLSLDDRKLVVVHAAWKDDLILKDNFHKKCRSLCLYGPNTGEVDENGLPNRIDWAGQRVLSEDSPTVVCGHQVHKEVRIINKVYQIDTGCVFGGKLTAMRWPERELVQVNAMEEYCSSPNLDLKMREND